MPTAVLGSVAGAAVTVVALVVGTVLCDDTQRVATVPPATRPTKVTTGEPPDPTTLVPPTATTPSSALPVTSTRPTPTTTTAAEVPALPDRPGFAVAASELGRLVVLDTETGEAVRVLDQQTEGARIESVSLSPDGQTVDYDVVHPDRPPLVMRVPVAGGATEEVASGTRPAVSPDGGQLAFATDGEFAVPGSGERVWIYNTLVVRALVSGRKRRWLPKDNDFARLATITQISWAPDSRRLVFDAQYENGTAAILDTAVDGSLADATNSFLTGDDDVVSPVWLDDGRIAVGLSCCYSEYDPQRTRVLVVEPDGSNPNDLALPGIDLDLIAYDRTGRHLLYGSGDGTIELTMIDPEGRSQVLGTGFVDADW